MTESCGAAPVLITGCASGIGRATALRLDRLGFDVMAGVRRGVDAEALMAEASPRLRAIILEVTDPGQIAACEELVSRTYPAGLSALVNNAGIAVAGPLEGIPVDEFRRQLEVNVTGPMAVTKAMLPHLRRRRGRIVFVSSDNGRLAAPCLGAYSASKFALEAIADALRLELRASGVRVIVVEPGATATPIWERARRRANEFRSGYSAEVEGTYGPLYEAVSRSALRLAARAMPADAVAAAIERVLTADRPRARYAIGRDARIAAIAARLPERLRDPIVARAAGMSGLEPTS